MQSAQQGGDENERYSLHGIHEYRPAKHRMFNSSQVRRESKYEELFATPSRRIATMPIGD